MYADRHDGSRSIDPHSLGVALAINAAAVAALLLAAPEMIARAPDHHLSITEVPIDPVPPPVAPPMPSHPTTQTVITPRPIVPPLAPPVAPLSYVPPAPSLGDFGPGPTLTLDPPVPLPPAPVYADPSVDARHADAFQPAYPAEERRAEREGRVVLRVLVGVDGRVKQVDPVSATSDAFLRVTTQQALARWRFRPGTRDNVPVERWRTMTVRFVLDS